MKAHVLGLGIAVAVAACTRSPAPAAPSSATSSRICSNLRAIGCAEGAADDCEGVFDRAIATDLTEVDAGCLETATSKAGARACGFVSCP